MIIVNTLNRKRILSNQSEKKKHKNNQKIKQEIHTKKKQLKNIQKNLQYIN